MVARKRPWFASPHHKGFYDRRYNDGRKGTICDPTRCAVQLKDLSQCSRKRGYGPLKAFCKQHAEIKYEELKKIGVRYTNRKK